ncbi:MAG: DUF3493 domain-containing protein [Prochlorococcaceae cyanobacterium ETNP18_MAG_1]|nr:DUF3493 domain-containing protein [Prochlorococcaceae cyanobacterium ETNP18_MAG_1]
MDPKLRERLLQESLSPWRGFRRVLWFTLFASGGIGLLTMGMRAAGGGAVPFSDIGIQLGALFLFGALLWFDRRRSV